MKTINEHVLDWLQQLRVRNFSPTTVATYRGYIVPFVAFLELERMTKLEDVDKGFLRRYFRHLQTKPVPYHVHSMGVLCRAVKSLCRYLVERQVLALDPSVVLVCPSPRKLPPKPIPTHSEIMQVINAPNTNKPIGIRDRAQMEVLYSSGMRIQECEQLRVFDVDIQGGTISIDDGKGSKARVVPIGIEASRWLRKYLEVARPFYAARYDKPTDRLWLGLRGNPQTKIHMEISMRRYVKESGCKFHVTPHDLRRAMATSMLSNGANIVTIQKLLGHQDVRVTARLYVRAIPKDVKVTFDHTHPRERSTEARTKSVPRIKKPKVRAPHRSTRKKRKRV